VFLFYCKARTPKEIHAILAPSDYYLFLGLKQIIDTEVIAVAKTRLDGPTSEFVEWFAKLEQRAKKCIEVRRQCVE
jgi:hypothetical protein